MSLNSNQPQADTEPQETGAAVLTTNDNCESQKEALPQLAEVPVCRDFVRGRCNRLNCRFKHPPGRAPAFRDSTLASGDGGRAYYEADRYARTRSRDYAGYPPTDPRARDNVFPPYNPYAMHPYGWDQRSACEDYRRAGGYRHDPQQTGGQNYRMPQFSGAETNDGSYSAQPGEKLDSIAASQSELPSSYYPFPPSTQTDGTKPVVGAPVVAPMIDQQYSVPRPEDTWISNTIDFLKKDNEVIRTELLQLRAEIQELKAHFQT